MMASGRSLSIAAKALSNSSLLLILIGLIVVPVASPPSSICSRKGLEKGSVALARAVTRRADGSMSRINWTLLPASSAVTLAMPVTFPPGRGRLMTRPVPIGSPVSAITIGFDVALRGADQKGHLPYGLALLRPHRERPSGRRTAENQGEHTLVLEPPCRAERTAASATSPTNWVACWS